MAIKIQTPPAESVEQFRNNLALGQQTDAAEDAQLLAPHKIYDLDLADIAQRKGLAGARFSGWRYLFPCGAGRYCVAEVSLTEDDGHALHSVDKGQHVDSFASTYERLHEHDWVAQYHYHVNYLRIPDCDVMAIWLRGDDHHHEMLIPLTPVPPEFVAGESYSVRSFVDTLEFIARERSMVVDMAL